MWQAHVAFLAAAVVQQAALAPFATAVVRQAATVCFVAAAAVVLQAACVAPASSLALLSDGLQQRKSISESLVMHMLACSMCWPTMACRPPHGRESAQHASQPQSSQAISAEKFLHACKADVLLAMQFCQSTSGSSACSSVYLICTCAASEIGRCNSHSMRKSNLHMALMIDVCFPLRLKGMPQRAGRR